MRGPLALPVRRAGFTVAEIVLALGLIGVAMLLVAQLGVEGLRSRVRSGARQDAAEFAANILEAARTAPWEALTEQWATIHRLPEALAPRLPQSQLSVRVEPEKDRSHLRRVSVEITWKPPEGGTRSVKLAGLFAARQAAAEGKP